MWQCEPVIARYVLIRARTIKDTKDKLYYARIPSIEVHSCIPGNGVKMTWVAPCADGTNPHSGPATSYDIRYSDAPITESSFDSCAKVLDCPTPAMPGSKESFSFPVGVSPTVSVAMKAADEVQNWSNMSAAGPVRRAPVGFDPAEPSDNAEFDLNDTPPTFQFRVDSRIPSYTIALSNSGAFSTRRYVAADGTRCVSLRYRIKPNRTSWTPTVQQWRAIKAKCGTGSAVYWRLEGKQDIEGMV